MDSKNYNVKYEVLKGDKQEVFPNPLPIEPRVGLKIRGRSGKLYEVTDISVSSENSLVNNVILELKEIKKKILHG